MAVVRDNLKGTPAEVLRQMPKKQNLKQNIRSKHKRVVPKTCPNSLEELKEIPDNLRSTLTEELFLIYVSRYPNQQATN